MAEQLPPDTNLLRRDMQAMLSFIQGARIVSMARETAVSDIQGWLLRRYWVSVLITGGAIGLIAIAGTWVGPAHTGFFYGLVLLLFTARMGALISIGRRIRDDDLIASVGADAITTLATLGSGINGLAIALMSSNAFGIVMYAFFASGLPATIGINGGIAPSFKLPISEFYARMQADQKTVKDLTREVDELCAAAPESPGATPSTSASGATPGASDAGVSEGIGGTDGNTADGNTTDASTVAPNAPTKAELCTTKRAALAVATAIAKVSQDAFVAQAGGTPKPILPPGTAGQDSLLSHIQNGLGLAEVSDLFKMLIWTFIAGFFESLVPDMLDSLAKRGRAGKEKA